ncbi:MAG: TadG family pilus assembly protein [candidate division NC10 bacterium]
MSMRELFHDERGSAITMFAVFLMAFAGFAAIAIDGGHLYSLKNKLQTTADAAVLVAVSELPDTDVARTAAIGMAGKNMPPGEHGAVLAGADVVTGNWDGGARVFTTGGSPTNAVQVVARRSQVNGNAAGLFFAPILGFNQVDVETTAIAARDPLDDCLIGGLVAGNQVLAGSSGAVNDSFCMYGRGGVKVGSYNTFADGTKIGMLDLADLQEGSDNTGLTEALVEMDLTPSAANDVTNLIAGIETDLPDYIAQTEFVSVLPDPPVAGTAYIVDQNVSLTSGTTLNDVVIVSTGKITLGSSSSLANVILAAGTNVELGAWATVGDGGYCSGTGDGSVQLLAAQYVKIASNTTFTGAQIVAGLDADLGSNDIAATALAIQAGNNIKMGSTVSVGVCDGPWQHARFIETRTVLVR